MAVAVANRLDDGMARTWARHGLYTRHRRAYADLRSKRYSLNPSDGFRRFTRTFGGQVSVLS